jgi:uncharacterized protein
VGRRKSSALSKISLLFLFALGIAALAFWGCEKTSREKSESRKEPPSHPAHHPPATHSGPRLAIIIDDMGNDHAQDDPVLALPFPLTVSILPDHPLSADIANEASRRGDEVMLHLPMESESATTPAEPIELRVGMPAKEVQSVFAGMLETVPHVAGVNNHEGSKATADPDLMDALMPALRSRRLFFIDSRTTASTVAFDAARHYGVPTASRKVFLDDSLDAKAIRDQIDLAARDAERDGDAIAIGHPHPETVESLRETLPGLRKRGLQLVFASDLVR